MGSAIMGIIAALASMFGGRGGDSGGNGMDPTQQAMMNEVLKTQLGRMQIQNPLYEEATQLARSLLPRSAQGSAHLLQSTPTLFQTTGAYTPSYPPPLGAPPSNPTGPGPSGPIPTGTGPSGPAGPFPGPAGPIPTSGPQGGGFGGGLGPGGPQVPRDAIAQLVQMLASGIKPAQPASLFRMPR